jgi:hypothetical protein
MKFTTLLIYSIIYSFFISATNSIYAQSDSLYTITIQDIDGAENGTYFNIKLDSLKIDSDTTLNFRMVPDLELNDTIKKKKKE